ncbi:MAG: hypothetical protein GY865_19200 [candidate division Zixibacteria bacterium]|nr:hypothetical protein [candidate division Zixibacteria bacterium]
MITKIQETTTNRQNRLLLKFILIFVFYVGLLVGIFVFILCILIGNYITCCFAILLGVMLYIMIQNNRVARIDLIKDNSIVLNDGKGIIELQKKDISYVFKFVRFSVTNHFLLSIVVKGGNLLSTKRYLFFNDSHIDLIKLFTKMKIKLKNFQ